MIRYIIVEKVSLNLPNQVRALLLLRDKNPTQTVFPSPSPGSIHSPVLYCRLPRFLKGERGLLLAAAVVPGVMLEDMFPGCAVQPGADRVK